MPLGSVQSGIGSGLKRFGDLFQWAYQQREAQKQQEIENQFNQQRMGLLQQQQEAADKQAAFTNAFKLAENYPGAQIGPGGRSLFEMARIADTMLTPPATENRLASRPIVPQLLQGEGMGPQGTMGAAFGAPVPAQTAGMSNIIPSQSSKERIELMKIQARSQLEAEKRVLDQQRIQISQAKLQLQEMMARTGTPADKLRAQQFAQSLAMAERKLQADLLMFNEKQNSLVAGWQAIAQRNPYDPFEALMSQSIGGGFQFPQVDYTPTPVELPPPGQAATQPKTGSRFKVIGVTPSGIR